MINAEVTTTAHSLCPERLAALPGPGRGVDGPGWHGRYVAVVRLADGLSVGLGLVVARAVGLPGPAGPRSPAPVPLLLLGPVWVLCMERGGAYDRWRACSRKEEFRRVLGCSLRILAAVALAVLVLQLDDARGGVLVEWTVATAGTVTSHALASVWLGRRRRAGRCQHRVVVMGRERQVADVVGRLRSSPCGMAVVGACVPGRRRGERMLAGREPLPVLGSPADLLNARRLVDFDGIIVAGGEAAASSYLRDLLRGSGVDLLVAPAVTDLPAGGAAIVAVEGLPLLHLRDDDCRLASLLVRWSERLVAGVALTVLLPALAVVAVAVRLTSPGPALFSQVRLGHLGRPFTIWKLRTMYSGAESGRGRLMAFNEHDGLLFKIRRDPRITPVGRFLRRFSIDEVPQLWNVVRGEMRLVGPRPPLPDEVDRYDGIVSRRLLVKPGLTGLWQVSGRADLSWAQGIDLDLRYVENHSHAGDLAILWKTVGAVLRGKGAY